VTLLGHYVNCDDAVCLGCWDPRDACEECGDLLGVVLRSQALKTGCNLADNHWHGFEDWEEPLALLRDEEQDTPTHCCECEALLPHRLTSHGHAYVEEALERNLRDPGDGRRCIVNAWATEYLDEPAMGRALGLALPSWPDRDEYSPPRKERHGR
jgi:hypothetical protein